MVNIFARHDESSCHTRLFARFDFYSDCDATTDCFNVSVCVMYANAEFASVKVSGARKYTHVYTHITLASEHIVIVCVLDIYIGVRVMRTKFIIF